MLRRVFYFLWWEGAFALAYDTWMGPTYLTGLAGELGVPVYLVSLLAAAPWIGAVGQVFGIWVLEKVGSVRTYALRLAIASRLLWCLPVFLALYWGWRAHEGGRPFPLVPWFTVLTLVAGLAALLGASSAAAWNSWVRGWVPGSFRGRFFGVRQRYVMLTLLLANLTASSCVSWKIGEFHAGYFLLAVMALISAGISSALLAQVPDIPLEAPVKRSFREIILEPLRNERFKEALILGATFHGALQLAGPYFPYFFTHELKISMSWVAIWAALSSLGCLAFTGWWGKYIDRTQNLGRILWLTGSLIALSPLPYAFASAEVIRWIAPFEYFMNGGVWSGYSIALTALVFAACPDGRSAVYFSLYSAAIGIAGAVANLLGARLVEWLAPWGGFRALWVVASVVRMIAAWRFYQVIHLSRLRRDPEFEVQLATSIRGESGL